MPEFKANIITEIPWNDGSGDKLYVNYDNNEKSQVISIISDHNTGSNPRDLVVTIQTNTPNVEPTSQVKFSLLITQTIDNTIVVATFDSNVSIYDDNKASYKY